ncbi:MAG: SLAC1 anion channel family protein [Calditerrivibrio sp.]|nr:SLAC1 anion channel family protein [Calditerrivibrio sp.]
MNQNRRLPFFPITFFASVMGLGGFTIALSRVNEVFQLGLKPILDIMLYLVTIWYFFILSTYIMKFLKYPQEVKKDFDHPIKINFIPTSSISLLLLSIGYINISEEVSLLLWIAGSLLHLILLLFIINKWFFKDFKINFKNPSWFIPVVGPILVPISGANYSQELSWFFYSIGIILWLPMLSVLMFRLIFNDPMPIKLLPTLAILLAPPAVGFISYVKLTGMIDPFAKILFYFGVFTFLMLLTFIKRFLKIPFFLSWWAYTFPLAAFTISNILYYKLTGITFFAYLSGALMLLTTIVVLIVTVKTIISISKKEICVEE